MFAAAARKIPTKRAMNGRLPLTRLQPHISWNSIENLSNPAYSVQNPFAENMWYEYVNNGCPKREDAPYTKDAYMLISGKQVCSASEEVARGISAIARISTHPTPHVAEVRQDGPKLDVGVSCPSMQCLISLESESTSLVGEQNRRICLLDQNDVQRCLSRHDYTCEVFSPSPAEIT